MSWKIIARHKWVAGATIAESYNTDDDRLRRFVATIRGYRNWKLGEYRCPVDTQAIVMKVKAIRDRIDSGDETVFWGLGWGRVARCSLKT